MTKSQKPRIKIFSLLFEIIIDLALIGMGAALYIHFLVYSFGPIGLSPMVVNFFGSLKNAVLVIAGIPFLVGIFNLLKTLLSTTKKLITPAKSI
jgi:hypothetical protein